MLLSDFHIHTRYSDGSVGLTRTVDLFGQAGFDVIAITDHVVNGDNPFGTCNCLNPQTEEVLRLTCLTLQKKQRGMNRTLLAPVEITKNPFLPTNSSSPSDRYQRIYSGLVSYEKIFLSQEVKCSLSPVTSLHPDKSFFDKLFSLE
jgi:hypothetical protein